MHWYQAPASLKLMIDRLVCADGGNPDPTTTRGKDPVLAKELELMGHRVLRNQVVGAAANAILIDPVTGVLTGGCSKGVEGIGGI